MKLVSLAPSNTEILFRLGAGDMVVATTSLCDFPEEAVDRRSVGGWINPDFDSVDDLEPDVVLASDSLQQRAVDELRDIGLEVRLFKPRSLDEVYESIEEIGGMVGKQDEAETLVEEMEQRIGAVELNGAHIYCEEWTSPPMVSGNWVPGLVEAAGGRYPVEEGVRSREIKLEELESFEPDFIIVNVCGAKKQFEGDMGSREGWDQLEAVRQGEIHVVDDALLNRPGPRLAEGAERIGEIVNGD